MSGAAGGHITPKLCSRQDAAVKALRAHELCSRQAAAVQALRAQGGGDREFATALYTLASYLFETSQLDSALQAINECERLYTMLDASPTCDQAMCQVKRGEILSKQGHHDLGVAELRKALAIERDLIPENHN